MFDIQYFTTLFLKKMNCSLSLIDFRTFKKGFMGKCLFKELICNKSLELVNKNAKRLGVNNNRLRPEIVELRYTLNILGIEADIDYAEKNRIAIDYIIKSRLSKISKHEESIKKRFTDKFKKGIRSLWDIT